MRENSFYLARSTLAMVDLLAAQVWEMLYTRRLQTRERTRGTLQLELSQIILRSKFCSHLGVGGGWVPGITIY